MGFLQHHKGVEAITDPQSGELSMSRYLLWVIVQIYWPVNVLADIILRLLKVGKMENWLALGTMTGAVAGIYWFNSAARVWREGPCDKVPPAPKKDGE